MPSVAVVTFIYNEAVNLPIWLRYYGHQFPASSLFVIDHSSDDGSAAVIPKDVNMVRIPRQFLDENKRSIFMHHFQCSLLEYFDTVIYTDGDEIIVPDPCLFPDLATYLEREEFLYVAPIGIDIQHMIDREPPIDLGKPITAQRRFCRFNESMCKPTISRIPLKWATGFHNSDKPINIDTRLFNFHLKCMDLDVALARLKLTRGMTWAESSLRAGHGAHARFDDDRFKREFFEDPVNAVKMAGLAAFEFSIDLQTMVANAFVSDEFYCIPPMPRKVMEIPERFRNSFW